MHHQLYKGKRVLITGHTGFKGSWLSLWLTKVGANVAGYSLPPEKMSHFNILEFPIKNYFGNINDEKKLNKALKDFSPEIVFHLAAQPLVRDSYEDPAETYKTNVIGSLNVYLAALNSGVSALVSITTDKVYENIEQAIAFSENDRLGGYDPYSSSKACVEIMSDSFRRSFLNEGKMLLATARAGNVIGGGDWAKDRLVPDLARNAYANKKTPIRNPSSIRPWQFVLEPLHGYLLLGEQLILGKKEFATSFNFGPNPESEATVRQIFEISSKKWDKIEMELIPSNANKHEAGILKLDSTKAKKMLNWSSQLTCEQAVELTIDWYKMYYLNSNVCSEDQLNLYLKNISLIN